MHPVFEKIGMKTLESKDLDVFFQEEGKKILFLWGDNCPNCEVAKKSIQEHGDLILSLGFKWYHNNVYNDFDLSTHFGLHGIPVFIVYQNQKSLGRITSYPGIDPFFEALSKI